MKKCPNPDCGVINNDEAKFCRSCGNGLKQKGCIGVISYWFAIISIFIGCYFCIISYFPKESDSWRTGQAYVVTVTDPLNMGLPIGVDSSTASFEAARKSAEKKYSKSAFAFAGISVITFLIAFGITIKAD